MNEIISVLPESVANQIAAGEVIQRPASVLKELVENALDAGADTIRIDVEDAGRSLIRVSDNGCGMSPMDARMAFERHATSKIHFADDLFKLNTMGFRGEALASIASVAQVELVTRRKEDEVATRLLLDGSEIKSVSEIAAPIGSSFTVRNLFFNVPARRRFLKSDRTEMNHLVAQFERIALVNPEVNLSLYADGKPTMELPKGSLKKRIADIDGRTIEKALIPVEFHNELASIQGFIGKPESAKRKMARQFFFVNNRFMRHPYFNKAVANVFEKLIPTGYRPNYYIYFTVDPSRIDVNIHPTKTEIKFLDERSIFRLLILVVKQALAKAINMPSLEFDIDHVVDIPVYKPGEEGEATNFHPDAFTDPSYNPFIDPSGMVTHPIGATRTSSTTPRSSRPLPDWDKLFENFEKNAPRERSLDLSVSSPVLFREQELQTTEGVSWQTERESKILLLDGEIIATPLAEGLAVVDVQRAKERLLYNEIVEKIQQNSPDTPPQRLLIPQLISLRAGEARLLDELLPHFEAFGFEISPLGQGSYSLLSVPQGLENSAEEVLVEVIEKVHELEEDPAEELLNTMAMEYLAVAKGSFAPITNISEAESLLAKLFSMPDGHYSPYGKPIFRIFQLYELRNLLG